MIKLLEVSFMLTCMTPTVLWLLNPMSYMPAKMRRTSIGRNRNA